MPATMTITGIDERTRIADIVRLTEQYPWLEIGMLYTATPEGRNRYPSLEWIVETASTLANRCALHVCGRGARGKLLQGGLVAATDNVSRIQINGRIDDTILREACRCFRRSTTVITQDNRDNVSFRDVPPFANHAILVDGSGGRGITPTEWFRPATWKPVGFAGGLGPDNLAVELPKIAAVARGDWWVDMETGVRTDDWFDIEKAKRACETFAEWRENGNVT